MVTEKDHEKREEEQAKFRKRFGNPDYDHWAKMESWDFDDALLVSLDIKPPAEAVRHEELRKTVYKLSTASTFNYDNFWDREAFNKSYMNVWVLPLFSREINSRKQLMEKASEIRKGYNYGDQITPAKFVKWAERMDLNPPVELVGAVKKYHPEKPESSAGVNTAKDALEPLSAKEHQELGMLRQQKEKWEKSIEATVEAVLIAQKKKITRDELTQHLDGFDLPFTTLEVIWKSLREKGFTKGPGRPTKEKTKNP